MRRRVVLFLAIVLLIAGVAAGVILVRDRESGTFADPGKVELPSVGGDRAETITYLGPSGQGAVVREVLAISRGYYEARARPSNSECQGVIDEKLPALGSPDEVYAAAAGVPDRATADMAINHIDALGRFLAACALHDRDDRDELRFTGVVLERRLSSLT